VLRARLLSPERRLMLRKMFILHMRDFSSILCRRFRDAAFMRDFLYAAASMPL